jgi:hypothetical protein
MTGHVARMNWVQWWAAVNMLTYHPVREFVEELGDRQLLRLLSGLNIFGEGCSTDIIMSHAQLLHGVGRLCRRRCVVCEPDFSVAASGAGPTSNYRVAA